MPLAHPLRTGTLAACAFLLTAAIVAAPKWRPISPEDLAATPPEFDPTAGAVILLRDIDINCGGYDSGEVNYYIRIKVFDQKGIDALVRLQVPYDPGQPPRGLAAHVVKPDGTIVEVARDAIYTREAVRVGRESLRVKSFSFPALEPGCIIEYQYRIRPEGVLFSMQLPMSDEFPIALARVTLRPLSGIPLGTQMIWSGQLNMTKVGDEKGHVYTYEAHDIPVAADEPYSPPETYYKPWFSFYATPTNGSSQQYWSWAASDLAFGLAEYLKPKRQLKETAQRLTAGIAGDEAKLQRLYDFCRTEIKNLSYDTSGYTPDEIEDLKPNRTPVDTLTHGYGTSLDINMLFGALLKAMGADPNFAYLGDRSKYVFNWNLKLRAALPHVVVAIQIGTDFRFYDPGAIYLPCGELRWMNDGTSAIVVFGSKEKYWKMIEVPRSKADYSTTRRTATFQLDESGRLDGDVAVELTGHDGIAAKHEFDMETDDERTKSIQDELDARLGRAEISDLVFEHVTDPNHPIQIRYHVTVPGYAEMTAGRMFVQPAFFEKGRPPLFPATERHNAIFFPYARMEIDDVTINLPEGFELENPRAPAPVNVRDLLFYSPRMDYSPGAHRLHLHREYTIEGEAFRSEAYDWLKESLDRVAKFDAYAIGMKRSGDTPESGGANTAEGPPG